MLIKMDGTKPIYVQISEWIENEILNGSFEKERKVHSQYTLAKMFNINPATAAKGLNILFEQKILYNKRGLGKFVSTDAEKIIIDKRKNQTLKGLVQEVVLESERLHVSEEEIIKMFKAVAKERNGESK